MKAEPSDYTDNTEIIETAENLADQARERNIHKRQGEERTVEAAVKIAARQEQEMLEDVQDMNHFPRRGLESGVRKIARYIDEYAPPYSPAVYLKTFEENEEVDEDLTEYAKSIIEETKDDKELIGKSNTAKAASAVYVASVLKDKYIPIEDILEIGDISEPTLRNSYVPMVENLEETEKFLENHPYPSRTTWG